MPKRKSYASRRRVKRRRTRLRRPKSRKRSRRLINGRRAKVSTNLFSGGTMPDKAYSYLTYSQRIDLTTAQYLVGGYTFRLNSTNDPDLTGGGHQPKFRDQMASFYSKYRVLSGRIKIKDVHISTGASNPVIRFGIVVRDGDTAISIYNGNVAKIDEDQIKTRLFLERDAGGDTTTHTLSSTFSSKKILNADDYDESFTVASNPSTSESVLGDIVWAGINNVTTEGSDGNVAFTVVIKQRIEWTDPITISAS